MLSQFGLPKIFDKLYLSLSVVILMGSMFMLYYQLIEPGEARFSHYKKASGILKKVDDYRHKSSKEKRKHIFEIEYEIKELGGDFQLINHKRYDHEKYVSNLQEFKYHRETLCFNYDGSLQESNTYSLCYPIEVLENAAPRWNERAYQFLKSIVVLVILSSCLFLFRKWCVWLVRA